MRAVSNRQCTKQAFYNGDLVLLQLFQRALHICNRIVLAEITHMYRTTQPHTQFIQFPG